MSSKTKFVPLVGSKAMNLEHERTVRAKFIVLAGRIQLNASVQNVHAIVMREHVKAIQKTFCVDSSSDKIHIFF